MVDTHCHLFKEYYDNIDEIIDKYDGYLLVSGVNDATNEEILKINNKKVFITLGIHPEEVDNEYSFENIEKHIKDFHVVGIGEIGLDYHFISSNKNEQKELFIKQLDLARKYNLPVVIHCRDAIEDTLEIINNYRDLKKVFHCYSGSYETACTLIKNNCFLGIGGVVTFDNAKKLQDVVKKIPLEYILLETDSPYLSPFRGKKNEPGNVLEVAKKIALIKNIDVENVLNVTTLNAISLFDLK